MDSVTRAWYGLHIENALLSKNEQEYEDFFCDVMEALYSDDFQLVKASGRAGDGKSDGFLVSEKCVFQSYAPSSGFNKSKLLRKIEGDFYGAKEKWGTKMEKWTFVHNDPEGIPKYAIDLMQQLRKDNPEIEITSWRPTLIKDKALSLPVNKLTDMFGPAPTQNDIVSLTHEPIKTLLKAISARVHTYEAGILPVSVDKLEFNLLSSDVEVLLTAGRRKENLVEDLLAHWPDPEYGEDLAESFRFKYQELKTAGYRPDDIFLEMKGFAGGNIENISNQVSALAVISYFFERCDIFDNPPVGYKK
ncbi:MAG: hypothetical protein OEZ68_21125 [Gammaproteobacteria bacterium]|nr:hypothetical protein [Gammaproteobacteria bacterium]MDH5803305.1 hypothetical protein [Gammaproteobacteria bacterium]